MAPESMRDFGEYRAMFLDFGVDPRAMDTMSLAEITSMLKALEDRRGKPALPSEDERTEGMERFARFVADDPNVRLH